MSSFLSSLYYLFKGTPARRDNIGSCGLHVVLNSFKRGMDAIGWQVSSFLSSLYYLFKGAPARREDFVTISGSSLMPLKFVSHRWYENVPVCQRALMLWDNVADMFKQLQYFKMLVMNN